MFNVICVIVFEEWGVLDLWTFCIKLYCRLNFEVGSVEQL